MGSRIRLVAVRGELVAGAVEARLNQCVLGTYQPRAGWRTGTVFVRQRLAEIERIIKARHGGPCDTDDGEAYLDVALPHLVALPAGTFPTSPVVLWTWLMLPRLVEVRGSEWLAAREAELRARDQPIRFKADTVAERLGVRNEERARLKLKTIGAIDRTARQRKADRRAYDREWRRLRRAAERAAKAELEQAPRPPSISSAKPWQAEGISRSSWYARRARAAAGQPVSAIEEDTTNCRRDAVQLGAGGAPETSQVPAGVRAA